MLKTKNIATVNYFATMRVATTENLANTEKVPQRNRGENNPMPGKIIEEPGLSVIPIFGHFSSESFGSFII